MFFDWWRLLPRYWIQNYPTSLAWDKVLNDALDKYSPTMRTQFTCKLGPLVLWVNNWPYAFGSNENGPTFLPRVSTRRRLLKALMETGGHDD